MRRGTPIPPAVRALRVAAAVALAALLAQGVLGSPADPFDAFFGSWVYDGVIVASAVLPRLRAGAGAPRASRLGVPGCRSAGLVGGRDPAGR